MNIYAIRDRLIDYYMQPFVAPNDKEVMAAIARTVNSQEGNNAIAQAPHHFEVWELGHVDEEGNLTATRKLVCDCSSLIRAGIRQRSTGEGHQDVEAHPATRPHPALDRGNGRPGGAHAGPLPSQAPPEETSTGEVRRGPQGGYPPRDG